MPFTSKYNSLNPVPLDHPGLDYWMEETIYGAKEIEIPVSLCKKSNEKIADYFQKIFADNNKLHYTLMDDYAEFFKECIKKNPKKFLDNLNPFYNLHLLYQYEMIREYFELWKNRNNYDLKNLLEFIEVLVNRLDYEHEYLEDDFAYRDWLIGAIATLIEEGTRRDENAFNPH